MRTRSAKGSRSPHKRPKPHPSPTPPARSPAPRPACALCRLPTSVHLAHSLYRKYASAQNHHYLAHFNAVAVAEPQPQPEQFLLRFHRQSSRRQVLGRLKEVYKLHIEIPRLFLPRVGNLLSKCYHRKRLLAYFRIAKALGLRVDSVNFSSFILSLHLPQGEGEFQRLLECDFSTSTAVEHSLLRGMGLTA